MEIVKTLGIQINALKSKVDAIQKEQAKIEGASPEAVAAVYCNRIKPLMDQARDAADQLEALVDDQEWPLPKMRELLFTC